MVYKIIGSLVILTAGVLAFLIVQDRPTGSFVRSKAESCVQLTPAQQLIKLINEDINDLQHQGNLPKEWNGIATIEYKVRSDLARTLLGSEKLALQRVKEGNYYLEVEVLDMPDEKDPGIILQMSLKEIKSKNKIFEIGRTYLMSTLNKQAPPSQQKSAATPAAPQPQGSEAQKQAPALPAAQQASPVQKAPTK